MLCFAVNSNNYVECTSCYPARTISQQANKSRMIANIVTDVSTAYDNVEGYNTLKDGVSDLMLLDRSLPIAV